jgi:N-acetylmuramic acid 6-phosphate (MurNAc-6-P) etherase
MMEKIDDREWLPVTEQSNHLTKNIDKTETKDIIELLMSKTDNEIFEALINDVDLHRKLETIAEIIQKATTKVILSGCGTSGRIAYIFVQYFNQYLKTDKCDYILSGNDEALIESVELVEDSCEQGEFELTKRIDHIDSFVYIGITCGLSAAFVAAQLDYLNRSYTRQYADKCKAIVLIGFNKASQARDNPIRLPNNNDQPTTFKQILSQLEANPKFYLLNPIVGPEPICGSTRMKSGTTTKLLLDSLALKSVRPHTNLKLLFEQYKSVVDYVIYNNRNTIRELNEILSLAIRSLKMPDGAIHYLCSGRIDLGVLGCVDASECVPTFGASREQIKCFVSIAEGLYNWKAFYKFKQLVPVDKTGRNVFKLRLNYARNNTDTDYNLNFVHDSLANFKHNQTNNQSDTTLFSDEYFQQSLDFLCFKLVLNQISTISFLSIGKVFSNYMIDVNISNSKLYMRAIHIIDLLARREASQDTELCLLKSIYSTDDASIFSHKTLNEHIEMSRHKKHVVPVATIMKMTNCLYGQALDMLGKHSNVRSCIESIVVDVRV